MCVRGHVLVSQGAALRLHDAAAGPDAPPPFFCTSETGFRGRFRGRFRGNRLVSQSQQLLQQSAAVEQHCQ